MSDLELHYEVSAWLNHEAELLDQQRFQDWLALLTDDVRYRMPVTVTTARHTSRAGSAMHHFDEDRYSLEKRVERLEGDHAWTEDPPSRTRRFVTNIRVERRGDGVEARSYLLLYRSRGDDRPADLVSAERIDQLRPATDGGGVGWRLAQRDITVDEAVLRMQNLAVFL